MKYARPAEGIIRRQDTDTPILKVFIADTFIARLRGVHAIGSLDTGEALLIRPCNAVHGFGMRQALDVVFLDGDGIVLGSGRLGSNRWMIRHGSSQVLELVAGEVERLGIRPGERLCLAREYPS